jgi:polyisoprenyl-phosphate glycosyltransferase
VPQLSVVVPVYGCAGCLQALHRRIAASLDGVVGDWELVLIDDRSPDGSWEQIAALAERDPHVVGVRLSRNFGQHAAITAGLARARGDWVAVMDCDLQDPPEELPRLWEKAMEGHHVVLARRKGKQLAWHRRLSARVYFSVLGRMTGTRFDGEYGSFSVISRKVVDAFLRFRDVDRHYLLILRWLGFDPASIDYQHEPRAAGRSSYGLGRLIAHGLNGLFFHTTVLLRWIVYMGFVTSAIGMALSVYLLIARLTGSAYPGWTSLAIFTLVTGGLIITSVGVSGLYVGQIFTQVRERPLYVVDAELGEGEPGRAQRFARRQLAGAQDLEEAARDEIDLGLVHVRPER